VTAATTSPEKTSIRFVRKGTFVPEMEIKLAKNALKALPSFLQEFLKLFGG